MFCIDSLYNRPTDQAYLCTMYVVCNPTVSFRVSAIAYMLSSDDETQESTGQWKLLCRFGVHPLCGWAVWL